MTFIGIDPGQAGGIAWSRDGHLAVSKMPETDRDLLDLLREILREETHGMVQALLEKVHSMPSQGVKSTFTFGEGFGKLQMALAALEIPFEFVTPQKWQKEMGCLSGGDKNITKAAAQRIAPKIKVTHAVADAILICAYCARVATRATPATSNSQQHQ